MAIGLITIRSPYFPLMGRAGGSSRCRRFRVPDTIDAHEQASISEQEAEHGGFASAGRKVPPTDIQMTALPRLKSQTELVTLLT
jgi:hypothetical protein